MKRLEVINGTLPFLDTPPPAVHGFQKRIRAGANLVCANTACPREISAGGPMYVDTWTAGQPAYCDHCGPCKRYERKHAIARGEYEPPKAESTK